MAHLVRTGKSRAFNVCSLDSLASRSIALPQTRRITSHYPWATVHRRPLLQQRLSTKAFSRTIHLTPTNMGSVSSDLKQTLTPALLEDVRNFWFDHLSSEDALILPGQSDMKRWFMRDSEFDKACVAQFQPALEKIIASGASATDILDAVDTSSPLTWLSILLLLDQVTRNCYRGDESKLVFGRFDPLAEEIALHANDAGIPTQDSHLRYRLSYRFWFHLPLMHSENLAVHEKAVQEHEETAKDLHDFIRGDASALDEDEKRCFTVLSGQREALDMFLTSTFDFEKKHKVIIERFGRYPHRNAPLGRVPTPSETEYLENGGETFT